MRLKVDHEWYVGKELEGVSHGLFRGTRLERLEKTRKFSVRIA
jgi:hypothetical protein